MNQLRRLSLVIPAILAALGCSDTLLAQPVLTVTPTSLAFGNIAGNSVSATQNLQVNSNQASATTVVLLSNQSWIKISQNVITVNTTPSVVGVSVNSQGLAQGQYSGTISVGVSGQATPPQTVTVTMTVTSSSLLSANPASLSFTAQQNSNTVTPPSGTVQIVSSGQVLSYTITRQTQSGGTWLLLGSTTGTSGDAGFTVFVNPQNLAAGTYNGTVTVQSTTTSDSVVIPVALTISPNPALSVTPANPPPILWQANTPDPVQPLTLNVNSTGGLTSFNVAVPPTVAWLVPSALSGPIPGSVTLSPKPFEAQLTAGNYTTNVTISSGSNQVMIPITLVATVHPVIQLSMTSLSFSGQFGSSTPLTPQMVQVTASDSSAQGFSFSSTAPWLTATTSGPTTPATLSIQVNPTGLPLGTSTGTITVSPTNGDSYTQTIAVTLNLTAAATLLAGPQNMLFSYQMSSQTQAMPPLQGVSVQSTGQPLQFTVTPSSPASSNCPANWLAVNSSVATTPATFNVSVSSVMGMTPGLCSGQITLTPSGGGNPINLNVTIAVSAASQPELVVSLPSGFGLEIAALGTAQITRVIALNSTDGTTPVQFAASSSTPWIFLGGTTGTNTPQNLTVAIIPSILTSPGTYNGSITISSPTIPNYSLTVPVTLTVTSNASVAVSPTSLMFNQAQGGPLPAVQTLTLTTTGGNASFTSLVQTAQGGNWLQISPTSGPASGSIQVSVLANTLSAGTYTGSILLTFSGTSTSSLTIPVTLIVGPAQTLTASPASLSFSYQINGAQPASQKITLSSTGGPVQFNVGTTATPSGWLTTDVTSGNTGQTATATVNVTVNPKGLTASTTPYSGSISISAPGVLATPLTIPVTLTVTAAPVPSPGAVVNGSSYVAGPIAPGELVSIFAASGGIIGPSTPASFTINSSGGVDPMLAGVRVLFSGIPGTPTYVSANQINVTVPWEINGMLGTNVVVEFNGVQSAPISLAVQSQAPGLFTANASGTGQISAINQNGSYNGVSGTGVAPATQGSVISVYGTGGGQTSPPGTTGSVTPIPTASGGLLNITGATATVGGQPATVQFAGAAPGLVTGVFQINVQIPTGITGNNIPVTVSINGASTRQVTTIAVQ